MAEMSKKELEGVRQRVEREARWRFAVAMVWLVNEALRAWPAPAGVDKTKKRLAPL